LGIAVEKARHRVAHDIRGIANPGILAAGPDRRRGAGAIHKVDARYEFGRRRASIIFPPTRAIRRPSPARWIWSNNLVFDNLILARKTVR